MTPALSPASPLVVVVVHMNRRDKEQRRKNRRKARQVAMRDKEVQPLIGQLMTEHADKRCPICEGGPRERVSCEVAREYDEAAHWDWDIDNGDRPHVHLRCTECEEIGYLVVDG